MRTFTMLFTLLAFVGCASQAQKAYNKGTDAFWDEDFPTSIEFLEKAVELEPYIVKYHSFLAVAYYRNGNSDKARKEAVQAILYQNKLLQRFIESDIKPGQSFLLESAGIYGDAGFVLLNTGDLDQAFSALEKASTFSPKTGAYQWFYCLALEKKGEIAKALDAGKKAQKYIKKDSWYVKKNEISKKISELAQKIVK